MMNSITRRSSGRETTAPLSLDVMRRRPMKYILFLIVTVVLAGCANQKSPNSLRSRVPYLKSRLTIAQADNALRNGMDIAEVGDLIGSTPVGSLRSTVFFLQDGTLVCRWDSETLANWVVNKDGETTEQDTPITESQSPFAMVDAYLEYLGPEEKARWLRSVEKNGLELTLREIPTPSSLWHNTCSAYGVQTPKGTLDDEEYRKYREDGGTAWKKLRDYADSFPPRRPGASP